jgi:hypothetical protein
MGRFRSFLRRVAKPAAMVTVAGTLALTLTVTSTQKAEANPIAVAPVILAAEGIVGGASLPLVLPSVLATSLALHPVGWVIAGGVAVAGLAVGAYYTKDYWLPYITGDFGKAKGEDASKDVPASADSAWVMTGVRVTKLELSADKKTYVAHVYYSGQDYNYGATGGLSLRLDCKNPATGQTARRGGDTAFTVGSNATFAGRLATYSYTCTDSYSEAVGAVAGRFGADPALGPKCADSYQPCGKGGPENVLRNGTLLPTSDPGFDPNGADVKYKTTVECIDDQGAKSTISADWLGSDGGAKFPSCAAAGKGHGTGKNKIEGYAPTAPGTVGTVPETIWETTAPAVDPNYDKCGPERPGSGCKMAITLDGEPCVVGNFVCENWTEFKNDTDWGPRLGCTYGPYTLTLEQCSIMEPAYKPGGAPANEPNTDGNPATKNFTEPGGQTFTPTTTAPAPVPGGAGSPQPSSPEYECWPQGWGVFNPADWIAKPLRCAFEPKKDLTAVTTALATKAETKAPIGFLVMDMGGPNNAGCPDWNITLPGMGSKNVVCGQSFTDAIIAVRGPLFGLIATAMVWPLIRSMWYAAIPILRVTPSGGK